MLWENANDIARKIHEQLVPYCVRLGVAGSLRRNKPEVKDIEIVCLPKNKPLVDLFGFETAHYPLLDYLRGEFARDKEKVKGEEKYFQFWLKHEEIALDLFIVTPPAQWGVIYTIRTGPAEFSQWAVTSGFGGLPADCRVKDGGVYRGETLLEMPDEKDFLNFIGVGELAPDKRTARWNRNRSAPQPQMAQYCEQ